MVAVAATNLQGRDLLPQHQALLAASAISPEVAAARGYRSVTKKAEVRALGFRESQCRVPALLIPVWGVSGQIETHQIRPDQPRINRQGKPIKYETPAGSRMALDVPPSVRERLADPSVPLVITEGARKADAAASADLCGIDLLGVWNWRGKNEHGGKMALPDWESIALNDRRVYIAFDSDLALKMPVRQAMERLKAFLEQRGARVSIIYIPPGPANGKVGLDDFLAAGRTGADLFALAHAQLQPLPATQGTPGGPYQETDGGLAWLRPTNGGEVMVPLTNFAARIVGQVVEDDGVETRRVLEIEARLHERAVCFSLPTAEFAAMNWPLARLGAGAVVYAGLGVKDHARAAIQSLGGDPAERIVFTHTGWRRIGDQHVYLHAGGAIGAAGAVEGVSVALSGVLSQYLLPTPPEGVQLAQAVKASLSTLALAPSTVTMPLYSAIWRAAMAPGDFSVAIIGPTGWGKTEEAALAQQHFGADMNARNLPANWSSTANALEGFAFAAKDALLIIDDFAPGGTGFDVQRLHREADRVMRAQGNRSGRQRMRADGTLRPPRPPRGLIVITGEDVPRGESLRGRMLVLELGRDALDFRLLTECQKQAAEGLYAAAMSGFLRWLAPRYGGLMGAGGTFTDELHRLRAEATQSAAHRRTPDIVANLGLGLRYFLAFAQEIGALSVPEADDLWQRGWEALGEVAAAHAAHQAAANPVDLYLRLVGAAIAGGKAHLDGADGDVPRDPAIWGWEWGREGWRSHGQCVGWLDELGIYLEPDVSYAAANELGRSIGETIPVAPRTLHKRLYEQRLLASIEPSRNTFVVRRTLAGKRRPVLHLLPPSLLPHLGTDQAGRGDQETPETPDDAEDGQSDGQLVPPGLDETDQQYCPPEAPDGGELAPPGDAVGSGRSPGDRGQPGIQASAAGGVAGPVLRCYTCGGIRHWRHVRGGDWICARCHPPASDSIVAERLDGDRQTARAPPSHVRTQHPGPAPGTVRSNRRFTIVRTQNGLNT